MRDKILGLQAQEKKYSPEYELLQSSCETEKLSQAKKAVVHQSRFADTIMEETSGVVIAAVVKVSQALFQAPRPD
jgi:hypothetical protein